LAWLVPTSIKKPRHRRGFFWPGTLSPKVIAVIFRMLSQEIFLGAFYSEL